MADCGCPPNDSALVEGPAGANGENGADATCEDGTNAKSRIDTSFGNGISSTSNSWTTIGYILFPGTANIPQALTKIYGALNTTGNGYARLTSTLGTVATSANFSNGNVALIDFGTITQANLSAGVQLLTLQVLANGGSVTAYALSLLAI